MVHGDRADSGEGEASAAAAEAAVARVSRYRFRSQFHLRSAERAIVARHGLRVIRVHAAQMLATRLVPAHPRNDGKQTPWGGHPVFRAQHATGTCCRGCLARLHGIDRGRELSAAEIDYVCDVICCWIGQEMSAGQSGSGARQRPNTAPPRGRRVPRSAQGTLF